MQALANSDRLRLNQYGCPVDSPKMSPGWRASGKLQTPRCCHPPTLHATKSLSVCTGVVMMKLF